MLHHRFPLINPHTVFNLEFRRSTVYFKKLGHAFSVCIFFNFVRRYVQRAFFPHKSKIPTIGYQPPDRQPYSGCVSTPFSSAWHLSANQRRFLWIACFRNASKFHTVVALTVAFNNVWVQRHRTFAQWVPPLRPRDKDLITSEFPPHPPPPPFLHTSDRDRDSNL